ncbi:MAG TPA: HEAT repeat domain-containing protein, partial [Polyangiaceae bacterium]
VELAPGDADSYLALERVLVQETKIAEAIAVLERLAEVEPKRARELYQRMAQYALQIYDDDNAIKYAARAVELNPDDAEGHRRLGEMYRSRQDIDHAVAEFRAAITKNDRLFVVYFELADLLLSKGQTDEADRLFRSIVRAAPDEELVARAARLSMQINLGKGTLGSLEQDLLPLAIGNPQRPIYRHLLVEIYGSMTFGLVQRVTHASAAEATEAADARTALALIGSRAVKPLLDALADPDVSQQRIAIDVLAYVQNRNAALPLFAFATGPADPALRARAMIACGSLADATLVPKYEALLFPKDALGDQAGAADAVGVAAVWGLARMADARALPVLRRVARGAAPAMRALAVLGLGLAHDTASAPEIAEIARSVDGGTLTRAAAAYALGELDAQPYVPAVIEIAEGGEMLPRRMALVALARMARGTSGKEPDWTREAVQAMADAVFVGNTDTAGAGGAEALSQTAVAALAALAASAPARGARVSRATGEGMASLDTAPTGALDVDALLDALAPRHATDAERQTALVRFADPIRRAALAALRASGPRATAVIDALGTGQGELLPFVGPGQTGPAADAARSLAAGLASSLVPLARNPDPAIRTKAIVLVARSSDDAATGAVVSALEDPSEAVQRVAIAAVGAPGTAGRPAADARAIAAVAKILATHDSWAMRILAAQALGRLGAIDAVDRGASREVGARLSEAAAKDSYALVRQASLEALASFDPADARVLAQRMVATDPEPRVREAASALSR